MLNNIKFRMNMQSSDIVNFYEVVDNYNTNLGLEYFA